MYLSLAHLMLLIENVLLDCFKFLDLIIIRSSTLDVLLYFAFITVSQFLCVSSLLRNLTPLGGRVVSVLARHNSGPGSTPSKGRIILSNWYGQGSTQPHRNRYQTICSEHSWTVIIVDKMCV